MRVRVRAVGASEGLGGPDAGIRPGFRVPKYRSAHIVPVRLTVSVGSCWYLLAQGPDRQRRGTGMALSRFSYTRAKTCLYG